MVSTCMSQQMSCLFFLFCAGLGKCQQWLLMAVPGWTPKKPMSDILHLTTITRLAYPILSLHSLSTACLHLKCRCTSPQLQPHPPFLLTSQLQKKTPPHIQPSSSSTTSASSLSPCCILPTLYWVIAAH